MDVTTKPTTCPFFIVIAGGVFSWFYFLILVCLLYVCNYACMYENR